MEVKDTSAIRDILKAGDPDRPLWIYGDNQAHYNEMTNFVKWDDGKGYLFVVTANPNNLDHPQAPIRVTGTTYEFIQYLFAFCDEVTVKPILKEIGFTDEQIRNVINMLCPETHRFIGQVPEDVYKKSKELREEFKKQLEEGVKREQQALGLLAKESEEPSPTPDPGKPGGTGGEEKPKPVDPGKPGKEDPATPTPTPGGTGGEEKPVGPDPAKPGTEDPSTPTPSNPTGGGEKPKEEGTGGTGTEQPADPSKPKEEGTGGEPAKPQP